MEIGFATLDVIINIMIVDYNESHGTFHDDKTYSYLRETKLDRIVK